MKKTLLCICCLLLMTTAQAYDFESAQDAVKNMGVGWNLGNTLEAHLQSQFDPAQDSFWGQQGLESETCWGQPVTKPELLKMMKEAGFGAIRVPVTWYNHMDKDGKVKAEWMARVHEVVDYVIGNGLYCIINVHHDTGSDVNGNGQQTNYHWIKADEEVYNNTKDKFENLWKQIATEFKDYDQHLLFESYNEMLDRLSSWCFASFAAPGQYDAAVAESAYKAINGYAQSFVSVVRATGGNNATRNLVVNTYGACCGSGMWNSHLKDPLSRLTLPTDGTNNHLIVQVHDYPNIESGIDNAKKEIDDMVVAWNTNFISKGIPMILGEWGTSNVDAGAGRTDYDLRRDVMFEFVDYMVKKCKDNGVATFYWMGLTDGASRSLPAFNQADLAERLIKAYHGSSYEGKFPTQADFKLTYVVQYNENWSELFLYGDWNNGSTLKLSDYKGIRVEMEDDSYVGKLQVKLYGNADGKENYIPLTGAVTNVTFANSQAKVGNEIPRITLQTSVGALTAMVKSATLIKADGTETDGSIKVAWGCTVTTESAPTDIQTVRTSLEDADAIYNLNGQRMKTARKGIYIRNGKKYIGK